MELQPKPTTTKGPAEWFTGDVYIDSIAQGQGTTLITIALVQFTPEPARPGVATQPAIPST